MASTHPLHGWLPVAPWPFDAVPMSLAALVVICVAKRDPTSESCIRGITWHKCVLLGFGHVESRRGRSSTWVGAGAVVAWCDCPNRERNFTVDRGLPFVFRVGKFSRLLHRVMRRSRWGPIRWPYSLAELQTCLGNHQVKKPLRLAFHHSRCSILAPWLNREAREKGPSATPVAIKGIHSDSVFLSGVGRVNYSLLCPKTHTPRRNGIQLMGLTSFEVLLP
jgi:hypothetical protein